MRARWLFFTLFASFAMPGRFISIFFSAHGQSDSQVGYLMATPSLISLVAGPLLCTIADGLRRRELVAGVAYAATILSFLLQIVALPSLGWLKPEMRFPVLLALRVVFGCFNAGVYPLVCAIAIAQLRKEHGDKGHERFGGERLWGAVSWAVCALSLGIVLDLPNVGISVVYAGVLFFGSAFLFTLWRFAREKETELLLEDDDGAVDERSLLLGEDRIASGGAEDEDAGLHASAANSSFSGSSKPPSILKAVYRIVSTGGLPTLLFFNLIFWLAGGMSLVEKLVFLFFQDDLHASNFVCGLSVVVTVVFEIPLFACAPQLLQRIGAPSLALLSSLSYVVRAFGYTVAPNGWVVLLLEPLHGVTYSASAMAGVAFVAERTPPELEATGQSLLSVVKALGITIGVALGGYVMEHFGSKVLYRSAGVVVLTAAVTFAACDPGSLMKSCGTNEDVTGMERGTGEGEGVRQMGRRG